MFFDRFSAVAVYPATFAAIFFNAQRDTDLAVKACEKKRAACTRVSQKTRRNLCVVTQKTLISSAFLYARDVVNVVAARAPSQRCETRHRAATRVMRRRICVIAYTFR
jgi:hypothetical protein